MTETAKEELTRIYVINALEAVIQYRNYESSEHIKRTTALTGILVRTMLKKPKYRDQLIEDKYESLITASALHDIGKVGIHDNILTKPEKLTVSEFEIMKRHVVIGKNIIDKALESIDRSSVWAKHCRDIILYHHERWDGCGYLAGLKGEEIPLSARIVAIVDVYDALTHERCYKQKYTHDQAIKMIMQEKGAHFDPDITDCFCETSEEFCKLTVY